MFSKSGKFAEYVSPSTTMKDFFDRYQRETNIDLWADQYEALQEELRAQQEIGRRLKKDIRQRTGRDGLTDLNIEKLHSLEKNLEESLKIVRDRKEHVLTSQAIILTRKVRGLEEVGNHLLCLYAQKVEPCYPFPADNEGDHYLEYAYKEEQEFYCEIPATSERDQQRNYESASLLMRRDSIDGCGGDCEISEITFQQQLQPSHIQSS